MFLKLIDTLLKLGNDVHINEKMKCHVSFKIGGPVRLFIIPYTVDMFLETLNVLDNVKILGNGTNVLPKDEYMDFNVISTEKLTGIFVENDTIICESGLSLKKLCLYAAKEGFSGFENAYGIPGSVGGAAYMNAGAFGWETAEMIEFVDVYDGKKVLRLDRTEMKFSYRNSIFKENEDLIILRVGFRIIKGDSYNIFSRMKQVMIKRVEKQPLEFPSAGSVFKRPRKGFYVGSAIEK